MDSWQWFFSIDNICNGNCLGTLIIAHRVAKLSPRGKHTERVGFFEIRNPTNAMSWHLRWLLFICQTATYICANSPKIWGKTLYWQMKWIFTPFIVELTEELYFSKSDTVNIKFSRFGSVWVYFSFWQRM